MTERATRTIGLGWALVACPLISWSAAWYANQLTHGRLGVGGAVLLLVFLPASLAGGGNAVLGRSPGSMLRAGILAGTVCGLGFLVVVLVFLVTVPPEFFN